MLRYIEKLAVQQTDLARNVRRKFDPAKWNDFPELRFKWEDIDKYRSEMRELIEARAVEQQGARNKKEWERERVKKDSAA